MRATYCTQLSSHAARTEGKCRWEKQRAANPELRMHRATGRRSLEQVGSLRQLQAIGAIELLHRRMIFLQHTHLCASK